MEMKWNVVEEATGCVHAAYPDGCRRGFWSCACGHTIGDSIHTLPGCGNDASASSLRREHEEMHSRREAAASRRETARLFGPRKGTLR